ncbi:MAG: NAD-dependent deacylase [Burkholderiaceae bacterium]|nr:NAD-dependent deacylase [Burkholderiaceae bacterium]
MNPTASASESAIASTSAFACAIPDGERNQAQRQGASSASDASDAGIAAAHAWLRDARHVVVFTGAGVSAESGIPTFRDALTGLWARFDPQALATEEGFRADPTLVWRWYAERRAAVANARPNAAHEAIARYEARGGRRVDVVTQNVDGLHRRAGSHRVLELHGDITRVKCLDGCGAPEPIDPAFDWRGDAREPPPCPRCGAPLRPDVVWFGEFLSEAALAEAQRAASSCDAMLVVGTSALVYPAAELPVLARRSGARLVVVDPERTAIDDIADAVVRAPAAVALPSLLAE